MKILKVFVLLLNLIPTICFSQWELDVRLTYNSANSWDPSISISGQLVHVVWRDYRDGAEIYYKRSTDGGISWGADVRLTYNAAVSYNSSQSIAYSNPALVHLVWSGQRDGNLEIYYKRSIDGGMSWGSDTRLTNDPALSEDPSLSVSGQLIHLVWRDTRNGDAEIYYKRSTDGGVSWGADTRLTNNSSIHPSVSVSGSAVHAVWEDTRDGNSEIYYKRSTDGGISWGADVRLTNDVAASYTTYNYAWNIASSGNFVHVVWWDYRDGNPEVYYKRSTDGGTSWGTDTRLTNNTAFSAFPSLSVSGSNVHVVWYDSRDGNQEEYYKRSTDGGTSWGTDTRLTNNTAVSEHSSISVSGSVVHVIWEDRRDGNWEIYYKRDPTGNPIGIKNINSKIPETFSLSQNYPNPFNPTTKIKFAIPMLSFVSIQIYNMLGSEISVLVNEQLKPGVYEAEWNSLDFPSGIYYYRLTSHNYSETKKMILLK